MNDFDGLRTELRAAFDDQAARAGVTDRTGRSLVQDALGRRSGQVTVHWVPALVGVVLAAAVVGALIYSANILRSQPAHPRRPQPAPHVVIHLAPGQVITPARLDSWRMFAGGAGWGVETGGLGAVVRTTDGSHWTSVLDPKGPALIDAKSAREAWVMSGTVAPSTATFGIFGPLKLRHTTDGGATWTSVPGPSINWSLYPQNPGTGGPSFGMVDGLHGWVLEQAPPDSNSAAARYGFHMTADAGRTWTLAASVGGTAPPFPINCAGTAVVPDITFISATDVYLTSFCAGGQGIAVSHDGARTWSPVVLPIPAALSADTQYYASNVTFWTASDGALTLAAGHTTGANPLQNSWIYRTQDGGRTWSAAAMRLGSTVDLHLGSPMWDLAIAMNSSGNMDQTLYVSHDQGASWTSLGDASSFQGIQFLDAQHGWAGAATDRSSIAGLPVLYRTDDGGRTWTPVIQHYPGAVTNRPSQIGAALRAYLPATEPVVLPSAIPDTWTADLTTDGSSFTVAYLSPDGSERYAVQVPSSSYPPDGSRTNLITVRTDRLAVYQVDVPSNPRSNREVFWTEPGMRRITRPGETTDMTYGLSAVGVTEAEFAAVRDSLRTVT